MLRRVVYVAGLAVVLLVAFTAIAYLKAERLIAETSSQAGAAEHGIVFGASVLPSKVPSVVLRDRVAAGVELLQEGRIEKLILSGDGRDSHYNEPAVMKKAAIELGANAEQLLLDGEGERTYDTCLRAKDVFGASDVILVTQRFHLPRAIYLCSKMGMRVIGLAVDRSRYEESWRYELREWAAWLLAFVDVL